MANESGGTGPVSLPYGLGLLLVVIVAGWVYWSAPLTTSRPEISRAEEPAGKTPNKVQARLWQDPLDAVRRAHLEEHDIGSAPTAGPDTLILLTTVPGGNDFTSREDRLRARYAVLAALDSAGWLPNDREQIFYWRPARHIDAATSQTPSSAPAGPEKKSPPATSSSAGEHADDLVAYEEFARIDRKRKAPRGPWTRVVVLWANNDALWSKDDRMQGFRDIADRFPKSGATFRVLGPYWSDDLNVMTDPKNYSVLQAVFAGFPGTETAAIFSPWATARDEDVGFEVSTHGLVKRMTVTDDRLAESLIRELRLRGVQASDTVALVSEWDTLYGQKLPDLFRSAKVDGFELANLRVVHYLMGLDGRIPGESSDIKGKSDAGSTGQNSAASATPSGSAAAIENPEGQNQFDYARRLARRLREMQYEDRQRIAAIGVLGSDAYDKLLLLQALRPEFPDALFFTTDLSARMFHPDEIKWTRNLIVASSFGLHLDGKQGALLPPFRDSYQTALYIAAREALGRPALDTRELKPKLFEIGRTTYHELPEDSGGSPLTWGRIGPKLPVSVGLGLAATIFILIFALMAQVRLRHSDFARQRRAGPFSYGLWLLLLLPPAAALAVELARRSPEPFSLTEGISIWPSELLRLVAAVLAIWLLCRACRDLRENARAIEEEFDLGHEEAEPAQSFRQHCRRLLTESWVPEGKPLKVGELWRRYRMHDRPHRWRRVLGLTSLYMAFGITLYLTLGVTVVPYRGEIARWADVVVLALGVVSFIVLTFYVLDVTVCCTRFIKELSRRLYPQEEIVWPATLVRRANVPDKDFPAVWRVVDLIAWRTEVVAGLVIWPSLILVLLLLSRSSYFDRWGWPPFLIAIFGANTVLVIIGALLLRRAAEEARRSAVRCLRQERIEARSRQQDDARVKQLDLSIAEVERESRGAFATLTDQPVLRAVLLPIGGYGAAAYLDQFARLF